MIIFQSLRRKQEPAHVFFDAKTISRNIFDMMLVFQIFEFFTFLVPHRSTILE